MIHFSLDKLLHWKLRTFDGFRSRNIKLEHGEICVLEKKLAGDHPTVVFIHGIGSSGSHFDKVLGKFAEAGYNVLAPDLLCHGLSGDPCVDMTPDVFYGAFDEYMKNHVPEKFFLVGNSLGGGLAFRFSLENPHRVQKLVVASPAGGFLNERDWNEFKESIVFRSEEDCRKFIDRIYHKKPWYWPIIIPHFMRTMTRKGIQHMLEATKFEYFEKERSSGVLTVPTLFIWGKSERVFSDRHLTWFKRSLPDHVEFEQPENVGHCPQLESPRWFARRVLQFLRAKSR